MITSRSSLHHGKNQFHTVILLTRPPTVDTMINVVIPIPTHRTVVTARCELRAPFACKRCGFKSVARVVGTGSASTASTIAILPAPAASDFEHQDARAGAAADGHELLNLVACPRCGNRDGEGWTQFNRWTRRLQILAAALVAGVVAAIWMGNPTNPAIAVLCAVPGALVVFLVGYLRGLRTEMPQDRVTFLSPEDLAAEEAARAKQAHTKKAEARPAPAGRRRRSGRRGPSEAKS